MVNTINPADAKPGEVYEGTVHGVKRTVLVRQDYDDPDPWESLSEVLDHEDVSDLVRLVPARKITRADLPDVCAAYSKIPEQDCGDLIPSDLAPVLDAVVSHLNASGGVLVSREDAALADRLERQAASIARLQGELETAEGDRSRWRRAHGIVEQERITARAELAEAVARAEKLRDAIRSHPAMRGTVGMYGDTDDEFVDAMKARLDRLADDAEAAEARTAPAEPSWDAEDCDACTEVMDLCRYHQGVVDGTSWVSERLAAIASDPELLNLIPARAIEAEQAPDPVTEKAEELFDATDESIWAWATAPIQTQDQYRRIAAHVLGQEANDE